MSNSTQEPSVVWTMPFARRIAPNSLLSESLSSASVSAVEFLRGLAAPAREDLVRVVVSLAMMMVVMVVMVVMLVLFLLIVIVVMMVMVMLVLFLVIIVIVVVMMVVLMFVLIMRIMIMIVMVMMVVMMLFFLFLHARSFLGMLRGDFLPLGLFLFVLPVGFFHELKRQILRIFHDFQDARAGQFVPGGRQDAGLRVLLADQCDGLVQFLLGNALRAAQDDRACVLDLVVVEFAEVLHVDPALLRVRHGGRGIQDQVAFLGALLDGGHHVGKLADTGGLDQDTVGRELRHDLLEGFRPASSKCSRNSFR